MKIGIIGGSFDPIHYGHLIMAEHLRKRKELDKIIFIPTGNAPHKTYENTGKVRLEMVNLAIVGNKNFSSSDIEISNVKKSYTVDTLRELKKYFPDSDLHFIIGLDNLFNIETWSRAEELAQLSKFLVANRIFNMSINKKAAYGKCIELKERFGFTVEIVDTPIIEISSSGIRKSVKNNESIMYLTPDKVVNYIEDNRLYK